MTPAAAAGPELKLATPRTEQLTQWEGFAALRRDGCLCDITLRSSEGGSFPAHVAVLGLVSPTLREKLAARPAVLEVEASSEAVKAILEYLYEGTARIPQRAVALALRVAQRWDFVRLQEAITQDLLENLAPTVATGLFALGEPFGEALGAAARACVLAKFSECSQAEAFSSWPKAVLDHILRSDDVTVDSEDEVLASLLRWRSTAAEVAAALPSIRLPQLSLPVLEALEGCAALKDALAAGGASQARNMHEGLVDLKRESGALKPRRAYAGWWAGAGSTVPNVAVLAGKGAGGTAAMSGFRPRAIRPHEGTLLFLDTAGEEGRVLQWFLRARNGRSIAGRGADLEGPGGDLEEIADVWSGPGEAFYILDRDAERVVKVADGDAQIVGQGKFKLSRPCALAVARDYAVYVLDTDGTRVQRFADGHVSTAAGASEAGTSAAQLNAGPTGRLFVRSKTGQLYISDTGNHRVQRWDPGASEGVTVAGGHGCGSSLDQLSHPGGIWVNEDGVLLVADTGNHRVVKWREGAVAGVVVAGGCGPGTSPRHLREPLDVAIEPKSGTMLVADQGNGRVVSWAMPAVPDGLAAALGRLR